MIYTPKKLIIYIIKEFSLSLLIIASIFISLIILTGYVEELIFLKQKNFLENIYIKTFYLTIIKVPSIVVTLIPFIFLFSGTLFFIKFKNKKEVISLNLAGFSDNFITLIPSIYSLIIGVFLVCFLTPISSWLVKHYEISKQKLNNNDNLIIISNTGIWIKEEINSNTLIVRADKIENQNFSELNNTTIYIFNNFALKKIINAKKATIEKKYWILEEVQEISGGKVLKQKETIHYSNILLSELKNFFNNANIFSIWNLPAELEKIKKRGYFGQEIIITFNKYLSLPLINFCMIVIASIFTLKTSQNFNTFVYSFIAIASGIVIYFFSDLSIALGKSGKVPLILSVWMPVLILISISLYRLIKNYE